MGLWARLRGRNRAGTLRRSTADDEAHLRAWAAAHEGVAKVFAMQAGREIRVMVEPEIVDDIEAQVLARDIAKQVEEELQYPGQIKITVVRETRAVEVAK